MVLEALKVQKDLMAPQVYLEMMVPMVILVNQVLLAKAQEVPMVVQVEMVPTADQVLKALLVNPVNKVQVAIQAQTVPLDLVVIQVKTALKVPLAHKDPLETPDSTDLKVLKVIEVFQVKTVSTAKKVQKVLQVWMLTPVLSIYLPNLSKAEKV